MDSELNIRMGNPHRPNSTSAARLNEPELARQRLTAALEIRERLGHGRIEETRRALEQLGPR